MKESTNTHRVGNHNIQAIRDKKIHKTKVFIWFILWEFHRLYFDDILCTLLTPLKSTPTLLPPNCMFVLSLKKWTLRPGKPVCVDWQLLSAALQCGSLTLLGSLHLRKLSSFSWQLSITSTMSERCRTSCPHPCSLLGFCLTWTCVFCHCPWVHVCIYPTVYGKGYFLELTHHLWLFQCSSQGWVKYYN